MDSRIALAQSHLPHRPHRRYPSLADDDEYLALLAEGGFMVQKIATLLYPEGREMPFTADPANAAEETLRALQARNTTLFEATLVSNGKLARIDILQKRGNEFSLIEVKAASYDSDENAAAVANGRPNLFRTKRSQSIVAGWREYLEDVAFQALVLRELFPQARIRAFLLMPDKSKSTTIDRLYSLFRLHRRPVPGSRLERFEVEFTGDVDELRREHFLTLVPVDAEVDMLTDEVSAAAGQYVDSLRPRLRKIVTPLSVACRECEYRAEEPRQPDGFRECWGRLADVKPPLLDLYQVGNVGGRGGPLAGQLIRQAKVSLYDVPRGGLVKADGTVGETNKRQLIQIDRTRDNSEWISDELPGILRAFRYPLHFIDFETTALAIPYHSGMHPYEPVAFQWSCHTLDAPDAAPRHAEWINVEDAFPNFEFADTLARQLRREGTFFMWATHENTILRRILGQMQLREYQNTELVRWLGWIIRDRGQSVGCLIDMNQLCLKHYFHPLMRGRTSIKSVCDAVWKTNPALRAGFPAYLKERNGEILSPYAALPPIEICGKQVAIADGTGAIRAYEAMMYGAERDDPEVCARWRQLLLQYCKLDTLAMAWIWHHWTSRTPQARFYQLNCP
jgi:Domain of unknown function(DUF2779)